MTKNMIALIALWLIYVVADYFVLPFYVQPFLWAFVCLTLLVLIIRQLVRIAKHRENRVGNSVLYLSITLLLFLLTFYKFKRIPNSAMERADWLISYNLRKDIVKDVEEGKLAPNNDVYNSMCHLPFNFPIVSNGGNDICILESSENSKIKTVKFYISRGYFEAPQVYFVYTTDAKMKKHCMELIKNSLNITGNLKQTGIE